LDDDSRDDDGRTSRPRHREEDDDDLDDRPTRRKRRRKKAAGSGGTIVLTVALVIGGLVVLGGLGVGIFFGVRALGGGAYAKHEDAIKETISMMTELADALESVKDPQSAHSAAARIEKVCDRMEQLETRIKGLPKLSVDDDQRLEKQYKPEFLKINERILKVAFQAGVNSQAEPAFMSASLRLKTVGERLQQATKSR
jgi:hypothetical protein